jgi:hypothetical protein
MASEDVTGDNEDVELIMRISTETKDLLSRLATQTGGSEFEVIGKAIALYVVALDAQRAGNRIGIFGDDCELEREIVGL